ncbi:MAG: helicase-related protein, partial [Phycisphaerales bacterium]
PEARLARMDVDTTSGKWSPQQILSRVERGEVDILLGTQMIAKGLDFPGVRLVGVINADTALNLPDFRAAERTFQLVSQVAGRCGRGEAAGRAIVQTLQPDTPAIRLAALHRFEAFAEAELADRLRFGLPPVRRMARILLRDEDLASAEAAAKELAARLASLPESEGLELRGPSPCPIARISNRHRLQIEVLADDAAAIQRLLQRARSERWIRPGEKMAVDVDPVALL